MSEPVQCLACTRFGEAKNGRKMMENGFGRCSASRAVDVFVAATHQRQCDIHARADEKTIEKRVEWLDNRGRGGQV